MVYCAVTLFCQRFVWTSSIFHVPHLIVYSPKAKKYPVNQGLQDTLFWRCRPDLNWGIKVLQTFALPLGHGTIWVWQELSLLPNCLERTTRLELATSTLARWRSTRWAKSAKWCLRSESNQRHTDFQSVALPTELQRQVWRPRRGSNPRPLAWQASVLTNWTTRPFDGGNNRARTCDPLLVRQMLSQLSYAPITLDSFIIISHYIHFVNCFLVKNW